MNDPLDVEALRRAVADARSPLRVDVRAQVGSTNDVAAEHLRHDATGAPIAVLTEEQTAGRGRQGAPWASHADASLALSVGRVSRRPLAISGGLPLAVGVACVEALAACGVHGVRLKWPNDLLAVSEAKLGGILVESRASAERVLVVAGVGLNVRRDAVDGVALDRPVAAIADLATPTPARTRLAAALALGIERALAEFEAAGFAAFRDRWLALHAWAGRPVVALRDGRVAVSGLAEGVDADGAFLVRTAGGIERIIAADVSLRTS